MLYGFVPGAAFVVADEDTSAYPFRNIAPRLRVCCPQHSVPLPRFPVPWYRFMVRGRCTLSEMVERI
jgi:hypothetical protein